MSGPCWSRDEKLFAYIRRLVGPIVLSAIYSPDEDIPAYALVVGEIPSAVTREVGTPWFSCIQGYPEIDWSPDGTSIAFSATYDRASEERYPEELYIADVSSASPTIRRLTHNDIKDEGPVFSPEGDRIAFRRSGLSPGFNRCVILNLKTGEERTVAGGEFRDGRRWRLSAGGGVEWWPNGEGITFWSRWLGGPPPRHTRYSCNLITGASEVIETR
jgi:Tol biopolymer transport system component